MLEIEWRQGFSESFRSKPIITLHTTHEKATIDLTEQSCLKVEFPLCKKRFILFSIFGELHARAKRARVGGAL